MLEKEYIDEMCNYIKEILSYNQPIVWSWGVDEFLHTEYNNMPALRFEVNGFVHKGNVVVTYNGGCDCFEVYCLDKEDKIINEQGDIYLSELISRIDRMVEKDTSTQEYKNQIRNWLDSTFKE